MTKFLTIFFVILMYTFSMPSLAGSMSGADVYKKMHDIRAKSLDHKIEASMVLYDKGGGTRTRALVEYSRDASPEACKALVVFTAPADLKGVGFLLHARTFADRDLWAYFPEYKRVRRIPTSSQDDSFFGTDFTYDDFSGPSELSDYSFKMLNEEHVDGKPCYVIEVTPKKPRKYTRFVAWIVKDLWVTTKIEYYRDKELYRSGSYRDIRVIDGIPTPFSFEMENRKTGHKTVLTIQNITYRTKYPDDFFSHRMLERGGK
jgi:hypothetical protein